MVGVMRIQTCMVSIMYMHITNSSNHGRPRYRQPRNTKYVSLGDIQSLFVECLDSVVMLRGSLFMSTCGGKFSLAIDVRFVVNCVSYSVT